MYMFNLIRICQFSKVIGTLECHGHNLTPAVQLPPTIKIHLHQTVLGGLFTKPGKTLLQGIVLLLPKFNSPPLKLVYVAPNLFPMVFEKLL